jgi:hypothetical protein
LLQTHEFQDFAATQALQSAAARTVVRLVKRRARVYADGREQLDHLSPGLSEASPSALIKIAEDLLAKERSAPRRWFGFGSEVAALNARALILLGRTRRRYPFDLNDQRPPNNSRRTLSGDAPGRPL